MLVPIEVLDSGPKLSIREQWSGATESRWVRLDTPHGTVTCTSSWRFEGPHVPTVRIHAVDSEISILGARRGISGDVAGAPFRIYRPRYGLRRKNRTVLLEAPTVEMASVMTGWGAFDIVDRRSGDTLLRSGKSTFIDADLDPTAVVLAIAFQRCGIIQTSTFLNFITF